MVRRAEFLPRGKQGRLDMAIQWMRVLSEPAGDGQGVDTPKWKLWGISETIFTEFCAIVNAAEKVMMDCKDKEVCTGVVLQRSKAVFEELVTTMRLLKRRFFHLPPLTAPDFVSLGLKVPVFARVLSGDPTAQVMIETYLVGRHQLGLRFVYVSGDPNDPANKSFRVWYKLVRPGEAAPTQPEDLIRSFSVSGKTYTQNFDYEDSGKTVYYCVQIENNKRKGPWGPLTNALIP